MISAYFPEKQPFPWCLPSAGHVVAMAMPAEDRLLILTRQTMLFSVPFASAVAGATAFASVKPLSLKVGAG